MQQEGLQREGQVEAVADEEAARVFLAGGRESSRGGGTGGERRRV